MSSLRFASRCVAALAVWWAVALAWGQQGSDPANWPALSLPAFVAEVRSALRAPSVPAATREAATMQSAARLAALSTDTEVPYADLLWLNYWGSPGLTAAQKTALAPRLALPGDEVATWSARTLRSVVWAQSSTDVPQAESDAALTTWLASKAQASDFQAATTDAAWLVTRIRDLRNRSAAGGVPEVSFAALRDYVADLLAQETTVSQVTYKDLLTLYDWSRGDLTPESRTAVQSRITAPQAAAGEITQWTLTSLRAADRLMRDSEVAQDTRDSVISQWMQANAESVGDTSRSDELAWLALRARRVGLYSPKFSVVWQGSIKCPATGNYAFSISPIDVTLDYSKGRVEQTLQVTVNGQVILDAREGSWDYESQPVTLVAGQLTPIRVEMHYSDSSADGNPRLHGTSAILMWESDARAKEVVPVSALVPPGGDGLGLAAQYRVQVGDGEQVVQRMEPTVDHVWLRRDPVICTQDDLRPTLENTLLARMSDQQFLATAESAVTGDPASEASEFEQHVVRMTLQQAHLVFAGRPSQDRYTDLLLSRPALLYSTSVPTELYRRARFASPDTALHLFGTWAQLQADVEPQVTLDYYEVNRHAYRWVAEMMAWYVKDQYQRLEERYLVMPDGSCCLPVAYVVAYAHFTLGTMTQWIEHLDSVLEDPQTGGDTRVNWLIARAHAEEIRRGLFGRQVLTVERLLAGLPWLQEATLVAQSDTAKLRAYGEMAARYGAEEQVERAQAILERASGVLSSPTAAEKIALWQQQLESLGEQIPQRRQQREELAQQAYISQLRERYHKAVAAENAASAARYRDMLTQAGVELD